jgi:hypothetical protein
MKARDKKGKRKISVWNKQKGRRTEVHGIAAEIEPDASHIVRTTETIVVVTLGLLTRLLANVEAHGDFGRAPNRAEGIVVMNLNHTGLVDGIVDHMANLNGDVSQREAFRAGALHAGLHAASNWQRVCHDCGWRGE